MEPNTLLLIILEEPIYFWPFLVYSIAAFGIVGIMIGLSYFLGEHHKEKTTNEPFESGIAPTGGARLRFSSHFYLIAMFFVIFDLDAAYIMVWAVSFRELGFAGYMGVMVFIMVFVVVLIYELGIGALDFAPNGKKILQAKNRRK